MSNTWISGALDSSGRVAVSVSGSNRSDTRHEPRPPVRATTPQADGRATTRLTLVSHVGPLFANSASSNSVERCRPSSVRITDFALPTGFAISPFRCSRSSASQSKPFHARRSSCRVSPQQRQHRVVDLVVVQLHELPPGVPGG